MLSSKNLRGPMQENSCVLCCSPCQLFNSDSNSGSPSPNGLKYSGQSQGQGRDVDPVRLTKSLCRLLELPVESFKCRFLQGNTSICVNCATVVSQIHELLVQLDKIQIQLDNFKIDIQEQMKSGDNENLSLPGSLRFDIMQELNSVIRQFSSETKILDDDNAENDVVDYKPQSNESISDVYSKNTNDCEGGCAVVSVGFISDNILKEEVEVAEYEHESTNEDMTIATDELRGIIDPLYDPGQIVSPMSPKIFGETLSSGARRNLANDGRHLRNRQRPVVTRKRQLRPIVSVVVRRTSEDSIMLSHSRIVKAKLNMTDDLRGSNQVGGSKNVAKTLRSTNRISQGKPVKEYLKCTFNKCRVKFDKSLSHVELRLEAHVKTMHEGIKCAYRCPHCPRVFSYRREQLVHSRIHTGETPFICDICGRGFRSIRVLQFHMKIHTGDRQYPCPECPHKSICKQAQKAHMLTHTREKAFMCELCSSSFVRNYELKDHQKKYHSDQLALTPYQCRFCDKILSGKVGLKWHEQCHTGDLNFKCSSPGCTFRSTTQCRINLHEKSHTTERAFKCDQCEKSYKHKQHLTVHLRVHSGEKPYKCKTCEKEFRASSHLQSHEKLHIGKLEYKCPHCEQAFVLRKYMNRHIQKHQNGKILPHISQDSESSAVSTVMASSSDSPTKVNLSLKKSKCLSKPNQVLSNDANEFIRLMQDSLST